jgi:hypothetical protein
MLQKSCAAMEIGQNACLLLCYIAHTEDAMRYVGPAKFWNEQLMTTLGFKSPKQLNDARQRACDSGWLEYERQGHREVGRYWVTIPAEFADMQDTVIEPIHSAYGMESGTNGGTQTKRKAERIGDGKRNTNETESGKPSIPIPEPIPLNNMFDIFWTTYPRRIAKQNAVKAWQKAIKTVDPDVIIAGAEKYAVAVQGKESQFIRHPATWLNGGCWDDEPDAEVQKAPVPGTREFAKQSVAYVPDVFKLHGMVTRGEITDEEYNRRCADLTGMEVPS